MFVSVSFLFHQGHTSWLHVNVLFLTFVRTVWSVLSWRCDLIKGAPPRNRDWQSAARTPLDSRSLWFVGRQRAHTHARHNNNNQNKAKSRSVDRWLCFIRFNSLRMDVNTEHYRISLLLLMAADGLIVWVISLFVQFRLDCYIAKNIWKHFMTLLMIFYHLIFMYLLSKGL